MTIYKGGCHCGKVGFSVETEIAEAMECNCSICSKKGWLLHFVPATVFTLTTPRENISTYHFNKHAIDHHFCSTCGIASFSEGKKGDVAMVAVNVRCLEGVDPHALKIKLVDGRSL
jgi:hypothetical protein